MVGRGLPTVLARGSRSRMSGDLEWVAGVGPAEWSGGLVVFVDEAEEFGDEVVAGAEVAALMILRCRIEKNNSTWLTQLAWTGVYWATHRGWAASHALVCFDT